MYNHINKRILSLWRYIKTGLTTVVNKSANKIASKNSFVHDCFLCTKVTNLPICEACLANIKLPNHMCKQCGVALSSDNINMRCVSCIEKPPAQDSVAYLGIYKGELRQLILAAKIQKNIAAIAALNYVISRLLDERLLGKITVEGEHDLLVANMSEDNISAGDIKNCDCDMKYFDNSFKDFVILPIPTPTWRLVIRGFDFPLLMAKQLHKLTNIALLINAVKLPFYVKKQSKLSLTKRMNNRHKYKIMLEKYGDKLPENIIIFDDVITTGNTTNELAKLLKRRGVKRVVIWALARGQLT